MNKNFKNQYKAKKVKADTLRKELDQALDRRLEIDKMIADIDNKIDLENSNYASANSNYATMVCSIESPKKVYEKISDLKVEKDTLVNMRVEIHSYIENNVNGKRKQYNEAYLDLLTWKRDVCKKAYEDELPKFMEYFERFFTIYQCGSTDCDYRPPQVMPFKIFVFRAIAGASDWLCTTNPGQDGIEQDKRRADLYEEFFGDRCINE